MLGSALYHVLAIFLVILAAPPLQAADEADIGNRIIDTLESWRGGGQSVMIAAPVVGALNIVYGINHGLYRPDEHHLVTAASDAPRPEHDA